MVDSAYFVKSTPLSAVKILAPPEKSNYIFFYLFIYLFIFFFYLSTLYIFGVKYINLPVFFMRNYLNLTYRSFF